MWQSNFLTVLFFLGFFLVFFASVCYGRRWFTVLKLPVYCVEVAGLPPFYHVEVAGLLCRSHLGLPLVYCVEVVSLLCRSRRFTMSKLPFCTAGRHLWAS